MGSTGQTWLLLFEFVLLAIVLGACGTSVRFNQNEIRTGEKIGVYAVRTKSAEIADDLGSITTEASINNSEPIRRKLNENPGEIMVLKAFMNAFPARTNANVVPVLKSQVIADKKNQELPDVTETSKSLGLDYFVLLQARQRLLTTGYHFREQWKPKLEVVAQMIRVSDGKVLLLQKTDVEAKPFDKYMDPMSSGKGLDDLFANLSRAAVIELMVAVGPVIREVPSEERLAHQKLHNYSHIRTLARKNNCIISGELSVEKTAYNVIYHVPCRDITLSYACESESETSRCWLQ